MPAHNRTTDPQDAHRRKPVATFTKPGPGGEPVERDAFSPSEAVALTFDGWLPKTSTPKPATPADTAAPPRETPRVASSTKPR